MNTLMLTHVVSCLPTARHMSLMCSSGPQGYDALKEMMHNGVVGRTLLIESGDLHDVGGNDNLSDGNCCLVYVFNVAHEEDYSAHIPSSTVSIKVYWDTPSSPPSHLLYNCFELEAVTLHPLVPATHVQCAFLQECSGITSIELAPLSLVTKIGALFLAGCGGLTSIDLRPLSQVTEIGDAFLDACSSLKEIDLSPLSRVKDVGLFFLVGCSGVTSINLTALSQLTWIPEHFLEGCSGLSSIDLSPLSQVTWISDGFLADCTCLRMIDMTPFTGLTRLPHDDLMRCGGGEGNTHLKLPTTNIDSLPLEGERLD